MTCENDTTTRGWRARPTAISLNIPDDAWEDEDQHSDPDEDCAEGSRLFATLVINGRHFHCEAIEVTVDDGLQQAADKMWDASLSEYVQAAGADGHFSTLTIRGREYAVFITPYCV